MTATAQPGTAPKGTAPKGTAPPQGTAPPPQPSAPPQLAPPDLGRLPELTAALADHADEHDRDASFPHEGVAAVHAAGLLTATVGREHGGPGAGLADTVRILQALGAGDPAVALVTAMTLFTHAAEARTRAWPARAYAEVLAESAGRPVLLNALRVEPDLGSPVRGGLPATVARLRGDHWELTGHKIFSTGAEALGRMLVWARTDENPPRVGSFLVHPGSAGLRILPTWDHLGLRASRSDDVLLDSVRVPAGDVVGLAGPDPGGGRNAVVGAWNALGLTALYLGVARAAQHWLTGFLHQRTPTALGAPLAALPRFQTAVGEIDTALTGAERLVAALAQAADADAEEEAQAAAEAAGAAKVIGTRAAIGAVEQAVALVGNHGLTRAHPLQRHLRDVLCSRVHTPQDDMVLLAAGRAALARRAPAPAPTEGS
ncbi:acyl-CoA/acyl-ACP dehydrogenase [Streptacidiphilus sp. PB12-B1b]|uniref:acyl-CoA dehydrogenase family protein n=1 Tax=Streptacidiphilus sp. PB12-B1b TaxID=2705012 RepID=UPI0015FDEB5C|nr:acyl-CoA dehydrogenase family protein [Streptacidiphilus sp. PB12-B1b]QMU77377.1 acyl-CoA/acyl-ACP dehydrogenase [Streptacidiphilus sp. PB12-B1b]